MLYKIILSQDRKEARVYFDTHSVGFYHSDGLVVELLNEIIFLPSKRSEQRMIEQEHRFQASLEETVEINIDLQLSLFKEAA